MIKNYPLDIQTTYKIGGRAKYFSVCNSIEEIQEAVYWCMHQSHIWFVLGNGSNILVSDKGFPGLIIKLGQNFKKIIFDENTVEVGAGVLLPLLSKHFLDKRWGGFEFLSDIPASIGGAVRMNAGTNQSEIKNHFISARVLSPDGEIKVISKADMNFSYRTSRLAETKDIVISAKFKFSHLDEYKNIKEKMKQIITERRKKQPNIKLNCGSIFKRPSGDKSAGWYIDQVGLKGFIIGDAMIAYEHANWIINLGNAKAEHVKRLMFKIQEEVFKTFGVFLEREVIFVPEDIIGD